MGAVSTSVEPPRIHWRGEIVGGVSAGLAGLPVELNYGLIALAPLGVAYAATSVNAALHATIIASLLQVALRGRRLMILGSRPGVMLILASLVTALLTHSGFTRAGEPDVPAILAMVLLCVMLGGVFQMVFGLMRFGRLIAFVPQPVLSGLATGIALSILLMSLKLALGFSAGTSLPAALGALDQARFGSLLVMGCAAWLMFRPPKAVRTVPPVVTALICGVLLQTLLESFPGLPLSGRIAPPSGNLPALDTLGIAAAFASPGLWERILIVMPYAMTIATLASIESMLTATTVDMLTGERQDNDRELVIQGLTNIGVACIGGPSAAGNSTRVVACYGAGGRTWPSSVVYALFILAAVVLVPSWIAAIPQAAISGMLIFFAWTMVDDWQRRVIFQALFAREQLSRAQWQEVTTSAVIIVMVALVAVAANLMQAVALGVAAALFIFVRNNARGVMRSAYTGADRHSLKVRNASEAGFLDENGQRIAIIEAGGALFFGSAERLAREAETLAQDKDTLVLDLRHVSDVDATGGRILQQLTTRLSARGCRLLLSHVAAGSRVREAFDVYGVAAVVPRERWFADLDSALEAAEDVLLATRGAISEAQDSIDFTHTDLAYGLDAAGLQALDAVLSTRRFTQGAYVFRQGEAGDSLFVLTRGSVAIRLNLENGDTRRIAAFGAGVCFGEMALIDRQSRSADAVADGDVEARELNRSAFEQLQRNHPQVASRIVLNVSRALSQRLRTTTQDLRAAAER